MATAGDEASYQPFAWWVSRSGQRMDYWAGATPGSRMCQCGVLGSCLDPTKWCNCDAEYSPLKADGQLQPIFTVKGQEVYYHVMKP